MPNSKIVINSQVYSHVHLAVSRQDELWENVVTLSETLTKIASSEGTNHISKVEAAKDTYTELHKVLRELGVW